MLLRNLFEAMARTGEGKTAVVGWGRGMGHKGHMMLASSVITKAKAVGGDPYFVVSRTVGADDPITPDEKLAIYKKVFPQHGHIFQAASDEIPDLTRVLTNLNQQGYTDAVVVVGADQVKAFQYLKNYNGKPDKSGNIAFNFNSLEVISRQETGDPSAGEEGPRATPMRNVLKDPAASPEQQFQTWRDAMSPEVSDDEVRDLMAKAKDRMAQFSTPKKKIKEALTDQINAIAAANGIKDVNKIQVGKVLKLPDGSSYTVVPGDTLSGIASGQFKGNQPGNAPAVSGSGRSAGVGGASAAELTAYHSNKNNAGVKAGPNPNIDQTTRQKAQDFVKGQPPAAPVQKSNATQEPGFLEKAKQVASNIGVNLQALLGVMKHESQLNPAAVNPHTGATGLIQFMPKTAQGLGTTTGELKSMPATQQLDFVEKYFKPIAGKAKDIGDLYMYTFMPAAVGKPDDFVLGIKDSNKSIWGLNQGKLYAQNAVFDKDKKGYYTVGDIKSRISGFAESIEEEMLPKSAFAGSDKNRLGPAAHLKGSMKRPAQQGDLVGGMEEQRTDELSTATKASYKEKALAQIKELEPWTKKGEYKDLAKNVISRREKGLSKLVPISEDVEKIMGSLIEQIIQNK